MGQAEKLSRIPMCVQEIIEIQQHPPFPPSPGVRTSVRDILYFRASGFPPAPVAMDRRVLLLAICLVAGWAHGALGYTHPDECNDRRGWGARRPLAQVL